MEKPYKGWIALRQIYRKLNKNTFAFKMKSRLSYLKFPALVQLSSKH
ncbi:hypothetical protein THERMOS_1718 [Bathymodiolus thermophilus thioautotrophic gill symbiont]|uniref:Uncharacterized protein n=1 Tax=Bathymodiolus thermophilus thioautotrophic gill symbiont TaxID=2360 RepID=A0A8H8XDS2_9GAMM|nr:hypothetical protein THERMOS_1718 [Bathymodiolus thermophilus thioautotrophic gill symbiont]